MKPPNAARPKCGVAVRGKLSYKRPMYFPTWINRLLITWFGCGRVPIAPGTAGSIGALPICWAVSENLPPFYRLIIAMGMTSIAILASAQDQRESDASGVAANRDPQYIVVDEVAGMLWSTILVPAQWAPMLIAFGLFRLFDVVKPWPARFFDRRSKTEPSFFNRGACIVLDDVFAGIYVLVIMAMLDHFHVLAQ